MATNMQERIARVERELDGLQSRIRRGSVLVSLVGTILIAALGGWIYYGYHNIFGFVSEPKEFVMAIEGLLRDNIPTARKQIETLILGNAPAFAETASAQAIENAPRARQILEDFLIAEIEKQANQVALLSRDQFAKFCRDNKVALADAFKQLQANPTEAKKFVDTLVALLEKEMGSTFDQQAEDLLQIVVILNTKLDRLRAGRNLPPSDVHLREVLMHVRALADDSMVPEKTPQRSASL